LTFVEVIGSSSFVLGKSSVLDVEDTGVGKVPSVLVPGASEAEEHVVLVVKLGTRTHVPILLELEETETEPVVLKTHVVFVLDEPVEVFVLS
jgi:hypothetical protein